MTSIKRWAGLRFELALAAGLMIAATTRFVVPKPSIALGVVFSFASLWMVFIVHVGWSDVGPIPMVIAAMTYFLAASVLEPSPRNHTCLALAAAVGFATLYMPMIYALIMLAIFAVLPTRIADIAATIATEYESVLATLEVVAEGGIFSRMIQNMTASKIRYRRYYSASELKAAIADGGADRFLVLTVTDRYGVDKYYEIGLREIQTLGLNFRRESVVGSVEPRSVATIFIVEAAPPERPAKNRDVLPGIEVPIEGRDTPPERGIEEALRLIEK